MRSLRSSSALTAACAVSLAQVSDLPERRGPVVDRLASVDDARRAMAEAGSEWFGVTRDDRFIGWVEGDHLNGSGPLDELPLEPPAAQVNADSTLREAMEVIMNSSTAIAVVDDAGRFGGVVTLELIRERLGEAMDR